MILATQVPDINTNTKIKQINIYRHIVCSKNYVMGLSDILYYDCLRTKV